MGKNKNTSALAKALLETAGDMRKAGLLDRAAHDKIKMRHLAADAAKTAPVAAKQIRTTRGR